MTYDPPQHPEPTPIPPGNDVDAEDLVDLNLDEPLEGDLQSMADEVADGYATQVLPEEEVVAEEEPKVDLESALVQAERQMEDLLQREADLMDHQRRLAADFNNFRNRAQRDIALAVDQSERKILLEVLPILDNFERSLGASYQDVASFSAGVELIRKQFVEALRRLGVESLDLAPGDPFDALTSEALTTFQDPTLPDGVVAAVFERGFNLRGQLLRAARVVVNRNPESEKPQ